MPTSLTGVPPRDYDPTFGGVYNVPDPTSTASDAIAGNNANMPGIINMVHGINPNYDQQEGIIRSQLGGNIPADVVRQLSQMGAERGVAVGSPGSANNMAALLQSLGLTSLDMTKSGMGYAKDFTDQNYRMMSPMFVTPEQQQAAETAQSVNNSAPNPRLYAEEMLRRLREGAGGGTVAPPNLWTRPNLTTPPDHPGIGPATVSGGLGPFTTPPPTYGPPSPTYFPPGSRTGSNNPENDRIYDYLLGNTNADPFGNTGGQHGQTYMGSNPASDRVDPASATGRQLAAQGYRSSTISGMTAQQASDILHTPVNELDVGGPAGGDPQYLTQPVDARSATGSRLRDLGYTQDEIGSLTREEASWILGDDVNNLDVWPPAQEQNNQQPGDSSIYDYLLGNSNNDPFSGDQGSPSGSPLWPQITDPFWNIGQGDQNSNTWANDSSQWNDFNSGYDWTSSGGGGDLFSDEGGG